MLSLRQHSLIFALILLLQAALWQASLHHKPQLEIVPSVPSAVAVKAIAFGDNQFFFRVLGFYIQNFGDTFGRYIPLKDYDYAKLNRWFKLLDTLDNVSDYMPSMASYYFSQSNTQRITAISSIICTVTPRVGWIKNGGGRHRPFILQAIS